MSTPESQNPYPDSSLTERLRDYLTWGISKEALGLVAEAADALERLQADTERLEWIEGELRAHGAVSLGRDRYVAGRGYIGLVGLFSVTSQHVAGDDVRAAIDAARSK